MYDDRRAYTSPTRLNHSMIRFKHAPIKEVREHSASDEQRSLCNIVIIDQRLLILDCLAFYFESMFECKVFRYATLASWIDASEDLTPQLVVISGLESDERSMFDQITRFSEKLSQWRTVVLSEREHPDLIGSAFQAGVRGFIPTSLPLQTATQAILLVDAGGVFIPSWRPSQSNNQGNQLSFLNPKKASRLILTPREDQVVRLVRTGKSNREIASALGMSEGTVKVHIHHIMKKLGVRSRLAIATIIGN